MLYYTRRNVNEIQNSSNRFLIVNKSNIRSYILLLNYQCCNKSTRASKVQSISLKKILQNQSSFVKHLIYIVTEHKLKSRCHFLQIMRFEKHPQEIHDSSQITVTCWVIVCTYTFSAVQATLERFHIRERSTVPRNRRGRPA